MPTNLTALEIYYNKSKSQLLFSILLCAVYNRLRMKTKICKQCKEEFELSVLINGKYLNLYRRSYCLKCSPFGELTKNKKPIIDGKRECIKCLTFKPLSEFTLRGKIKHYRSCCKSCESDRVLEYAQALKRRAVDYLGGKCITCGYNKSVKALQFHHRDPSQKSFTIGKKNGLKWDTIRPELDKCDLLCANCHFEIH